MQTVCPSENPNTEVELASAFGDDDAEVDLPELALGRLKLAFLDRETVVETSLLQYLYRRIVSLAQTERAQANQQGFLNAVQRLGMGLNDFADDGEVTGNSFRAFCAERNNPFCPATR